MASTCATGKSESLRVDPGFFWGSLSISLSLSFSSIYTDYVKLRMNVITLLILLVVVSASVLDVSPPSLAKVSLKQVMTKHLSASHRSLRSSEITAFAMNYADDDIYIGNDGDEEERSALTKVRIYLDVYFKTYCMLYI